MPWWPFARKDATPSKKDDPPKEEEVRRELYLSPLLTINPEGYCYYFALDKSDNKVYYVGIPTTSVTINTVEYTGICKSSISIDYIYTAPVNTIRCISVKDNILIKHFNLQRMDDTNIYFERIHYNNDCLQHPKSYTVAEIAPFANATFIPRGHEEFDKLAVLFKP